MTSLGSPVLAAASDDTSSLSPSHLLVSGLLIVLMIGVVALFVAVLLSILRSDLGAGMKVLWVIFVFCLPVLAWFAWYLLGRPEATRVSSSAR